MLTCYQETSDEVSDDKTLALIKDSFGKITKINNRAPIKEIIDRIKKTLRS